MVMGTWMPSLAPWVKASCGLIGIANSPRVMPTVTGSLTKRRSIKCSFDNDGDGNIFKAIFGSGFASLSFGNVAQSGLSEEFVLGDLTVIVRRITSFPSGRFFGTTGNSENGPGPAKLPCSAN